MSVQFGRWNFDGKPVGQDYLEKVRPLLAPYGPDAAGSYSNEDIRILYHALHTTEESRRETQPHVARTGEIVTWDGRLDNRPELIGQMGHLVTARSTDVEIASAAYEHWREDCFSRLIGDWALSIWNPNTRLLILAKDPIGTRHLFYSLDEKQVSWSTILDPLILFAGKPFTLSEEYIAGWFSFLAAAHLTPYVGIHSVAPSSCVLIRAAKYTVSKYWDFDPRNGIRYRTDAEYEEHYRTVFAEAVRRRLRSDRPILAELSGGMDSSSIVCMADTIIARGSADPRLDTVSYYDDSEPNWNERPYFTKVEQKRGRAGTHIDVGKQEVAAFDFNRDHFAATPVSGFGRTSEASRQFADCITAHGTRVVLSGIGGDEFNGGVPTPTPELQDLLASGQFSALAHQLKTWALDKRKPWFHMLAGAIRSFFAPALVGVPKHLRPAPWLNPSFVRRNRAALHGYENRIRLFGPLPSFQETRNTLEVLRRQLESCVLSSEPVYEKRYPYLDRNFLEFICSIPREQLVRPGERRSLMRRALLGVVPDEILHRKRKAYIARGPRAEILADWTRYADGAHRMMCASLGFVETQRFLDALQRAHQGREVSMVTLMRTLSLELWLRCLSRHRILDGLPGDRSGAAKLRETAIRVAQN